MENYKYICEYCSKKYIPKRRGIQRFCSNSCRTRNWQKKKKSQSKELIEQPLGLPNTPTNIQKAEKMSAAGIGNAALGSLAADTTKAIVQNIFAPDTLPATKNDIKEIKELIYRRYFLIHNMESKLDGALPYFDLATGNVVYR